MEKHVAELGLPWTSFRSVVFSSRRYLGVPRDAMSDDDVTLCQAQNHMSITVFGDGSHWRSSQREPHGVHSRSILFEAVNLWLNTFSPAYVLLGAGPLVEIPVSSPQTQRACLAARSIFTALSPTSVTTWIGSLIVLCTDWNSFLYLCTEISSSPSRTQKM